MKLKKLIRDRRVLGFLMCFSFIMIAGEVYLTTKLMFLGKGFGLSIGFYMIFPHCIIIVVMYLLLREK